MGTPASVTPGAGRVPIADANGKLDAWVTGGAGSGDLLSTNNLSDVANAATSRTNLGLVAIAASGSASDLSTGTIPDARMPDFTGDVTTVQGGVATTLATVN